MKFLLISQNEEHTFLLHQLEQEGHETMLLSREVTGAWEGIVKRAPGLKEAMEWGPGAVLFDGPGFGALAKKIAESGVPVFNGGKIHDRLHEDFLIGMDILANNRVRTPDFEKFTSAADAVEYMLDKEQAWHLRCPGGHQHSTSNTLDMQIHLEERSRQGILDKKFTLQRGFPSFVNRRLVVRPEFFVAGCFNERGLMNPPLYFQETHGLLPEDMGIPTREGVTIRSLSLTSEVVKQTLLRLEAPLRALNYTGWVFLGCMVEPHHGPRLLGGEDEGPEVYVQTFSLTPTPGFWAAFVHGLGLRLDRFLDRALHPKSRNTPYDFHGGWVASRKLTLPPYPLTEAPWISSVDKKALANSLPEVVIPKLDRGVYWNQIRDDDGDTLASGPVLGYLAGRGRDQRDAVEDLRTTFHSLSIPAKQCRLDPNMDSEFDFSIMGAWGMLGDCLESSPAPTPEKAREVA